MSNFPINNLNAAFTGKPGPIKAAKSGRSGINTNDSFKPSVKSATSPIDLKAAAKLFAKKTEEIPNVKWEFQANEKTIFTAEPVFMEDGTMLVRSFDKNIYAVDPENGNKKWEFNSRTFSYNPPTVGPDNILYTDTGGGKTSLCAIDGKTGKMLWEKEVGGNIYTHSPMMGPDGNIYVSNGYYSDLIGFDPKTGEEKNKIKVGRHSTLLRGINDKGIAVMLRDNSYVAGIDIKTGEKLWDHSAGPEFNEVKSTYSSDGCLYVASREGDLTGIDGNTGKLKWRFNTGSFDKKNAKTFQIMAAGTTATGVNRELLDRKPSVIQDPIIGKDGKVYFYDERSVLFAMDPDSGKPAWIYDSTQEITTKPYITEKGEIIVGNEKREVAKLDPDTGKEIWKVQISDEPVGKPVVTGDNTLFIQTKNGHTARLNAETGKVLMSYDTPGRDLKMAALPGKDSDVIVCDGNGRVICIGRMKLFEPTAEVKAELEADEEKNLKIEKGKEFIEIGGVKVKINKKDTSQEA